MDYGSLEKEKPGDADRFVRDLELDIFTVTPAEVEAALNNVSDGALISKLIQASVPRPPDPAFEDEFGGPKSTFKRPTKNTWTLVILSGLKETGKELKVGILKRMLAAALPIGCEIIIAVNGERSLRQSSTRRWLRDGP